MTEVLDQYDKNHWFDLIISFLFANKLKPRSDTMANLTNTHSIGLPRTAIKSFFQRGQA